MQSWGLCLPALLVVHPPWLKAKLRQVPFSALLNKVMIHQFFPLEYGKFASSILTKQIEGLFAGEKKDNSQWMWSQTVPGTVKDYDAGQIVQFLIEIEETD